MLPQNAVFVFKTPKMSRLRIHDIWVYSHRLHLWVETPRIWNILFCFYYIVNTVILLNIPFQGQDTGYLRNTVFTQTHAEYVVVMRNITQQCKQEETWKCSRLTFQIKGKRLYFLFPHCYTTY